MLDLRELTDQLRDVASAHPELSRPVLLDLGDTGVIHIEGGAVDNVTKPADCRIAISSEKLESVMQGDLDPLTAFMMGELKVEGDMELALQAASALSAS